MSDESILLIICIIFVFLSSVGLLYCLVSIYKFRERLLWIKNRPDLSWLMILIGVFLILDIVYALYAFSKDDTESIIMITLVLSTGTIFFLVASKILDRLAAVFDKSQFLAEESISDEAMGIYNRAYFVLRLKEEFIMAKRHDMNFSVLLVAVDYFEKIDSSYGPEYTRKFIKSFSEFIKNSVRETDIMARFDKEEIIILLQNTGIEGAKIAAGKIQNAIENKTFYIDTKDEMNQMMIACTVSVGVATYSNSLKNSDQLIEQVDVALFKARDRGRNQVAVYGE